MRIAFGIMLFLTSANIANAVEVKLGSEWIQKLGQLCAAAQFGSRMTAEPICVELEKIFSAAVQEEAKSKELEKSKATPRE